MSANYTGRDVENINDILKDWDEGSGRRHVAQQIPMLGPLIYLKCTMGVPIGGTENEEIRHMPTLFQGFNHATRVCKTSRRFCNSYGMSYGGDSNCYANQVGGKYNVNGFAEFFSSTGAECVPVKASQEVINHTNNAKSSKPDEFLTHLIYHSNNPAFGLTLPSSFDNSEIDTADPNSVAIHDCYVSTGQAILEVLFGTTVTRSFVMLGNGAAKL